MMPNVEKTDISKITFLPDTPICGTDDDQLGHLSVANTIKDALDRWDAKSPFTIGLFGGWGTGKSGVGTLLSKLIKDSKENNIAVVEFGVWRYEKDSFRRQFLIFLDSPKGLDTNLPQIQSLYKTTVDVADLPVKPQGFVDRVKRWLKIIGIITFFIVAAGLFYISEQFQDNDKLNQLFKGLGTLSLFSGTLLTFLVGAVNKLLYLLVDSLGKGWSDLFKTKKIQNINHQVTYPEKFKEYFDDIVNTAKEKGLRKVVVIIDNLDRVHDDKILELLSSIKTYLERNEVAFIVQCDDGAIKRHLEHIYRYNSTEDGVEIQKSRDYTDEFLRKFFNTYVRIPPFLSSDLDQYTKSLVVKTNLPFAESDEVIAAISSSHRGNPRKIKQFINTLVSRYLLAYHKETDQENPELQPGTVTKNPGMLTKVLVLEQQFPNFYEKLQETTYLWSHVDLYIRTGNSPKDEKEKNTLNEIWDNNLGLRTFLNTTKTITTSDIAPFVFLKQSYASQKVDTGTELRQALEDDERQKVLSFMENISPEKVTDYQDFLVELLNNSSNEIRVFNIVNSILYSSRKKNIFNEHLFNKIASYVVGDVKNRSYATEGFEVGLIFDVLIPNVNATFKNQLLDTYVRFFPNIISDKPNVNIDMPEYKKDFIKCLAANVNLFNKKHTNSIKRELAENTYFANNLDLIKPLFDSDDTSSKVISKKLLENVINGLGNNDLTLDSENAGLLFKIRTILNAAPQFDNKTTILLLNKIKELLSEEKATTNNEVAQRVNTALATTITNLRGNIDSLDILDSLSRRLKINYDQNNDEDTRVGVGANLLRLRDIAINDFGEDIHPLADSVNALLRDTSLSYIKKIDNELTVINGKGEENDNYREILESRAMSQNDIFNFLIEKYDAEYRDMLLGRAIKDSSYYQHALAKLDDIKSFKNKKRIAECILSKAKNENFPHKTDLLKNLIKVSYEDAGFKNTLINFVGDVLRNPNIDHQKQTCSVIEDFKNKKYLSEKHLQLLSTNSVEYLVSQGANRVMQNEGVCGCVVDLPLEKEPTNKLVELLISGLIHHIESTPIVNKILSWLKRLGVKSSAYSDQFERIYNELIRRNQNVQRYISKQLIELGLIDKRSKDYYQRIKNMSGE